MQPEDLPHLPEQGGAQQLLRALPPDLFFAEPLFDALPDVVFFVKDAQARYVLVNKTLVARCGLREKSALLGRTPTDVFASRFGATYLAQDESVLSTGSEIHDQLELHLYPNRDPGWCLTHKIPLRDAGGRIIGLAGISRDLAMPDKKHPVYQRIAAAAHFIQEHYDQNVQFTELAALASLSVSQIERYFKKIFYLSPRQMLVKARLEAATRMLAGDTSITDVAIACGYHDHSAFSRQFKATVGVTPTEYREMLRKV
ncbi:AraC family transcriptional regulator [Noviherbaspirillum denitrificans]|uniref:AraC family transcriptional regulator n=2 Tax=Noviherbaspirillum denitrificans TaxID=1968433 RepID=A0A254TSP7_9BURK|nr:AraC family transcriptional regulator [Noviherbaspirillum denitrificans]